MVDTQSSGRVRVAVVDDTADIRFLLRLLFESDDRFDLVGEAGDGLEAIELAAAEQPDLIVLDREMPRMGGVEAIPEIRRVSPRTAVVLFTAGADAGTYQAALSAGALRVVEKTTVDDHLLDILGRTLVGHLTSLSSGIAVQVGPLPSAAARVWIANTRGIISALAAHPEVLGDAVHADVLELFERFLESWADVAARSEEFLWYASAQPEDVRRLVEEWAVIDQMTDDQLATLGVTWSPPEGQPFFVALITNVLAALEAHAATEQLGERLRVQWAPWNPADAASPIATVPGGPGPARSRVAASDEAGDERR